MTKFHNRFFIAVLVAMLVASNIWGAVFAATISPAEAAESVRTSLVQAQLALTNDPNAAVLLAQEAASTYQTQLSQFIAASNPDADLRILSAFESLTDSIRRGDVSSFAAARAQIWSGVLAGSYTVVENALQNGDGTTARTWLSVREFRAITRFSRSNVSATLAVEGFIGGTVSAEDVLQSVRADLLDTYQARMTEALHDLVTADMNGFTARRAELASLADGYFFILSPAYFEQRGEASLMSAQFAFVDLRITAIEKPQSLNEKIASVENSLNNFRAAPLTPMERSRRAGQLLRFLSLVPVEYERGVLNGRVAKGLEIQEAITFHEGAYAAFSDLKNLLDAQDHDQTVRVDTLFRSLGDQLAETGTGKSVARPEAIQSQTNQLSSTLKNLIPSEWLKSSGQSDFDILATMLDQMETAARNGDYSLAESSRLDAYAIMETGPEAKLMVFAPELKLQLEELFWNGQGKNKGLAYLIRNQAPYSEIKASRLALDVYLSEAQTELTQNTAPTAVAVNAGIIVFREGLEVVVILASLMSSLKSAEERKYRMPMWLGSLLALIATMLTWLLAQEVLESLARYGEKLEAVVSIIAIAVLLVIMNWFFHKTYWTSWLANFHATKRRLLNKETGLFLGLIALGFTSVYREGFEIVLFLQALVLEGGIPVVLIGVIGASIAVALVGMIVFRLQRNLPYMKILIITGVLIGSVLLQMVGSTIHVLQVVGWLPVHVIQVVQLPYWLGTWFGVYATWEGLGFQLVVTVFVIGSYYLAEGMRKHRLSTPRQQMTKSAIKS